MKKSVIILILFLLSYSISSGQDRTFGIKGGFSISNFWGDGTDRFNDQIRSVIPDLDEQNLYWFSVGFFNVKEILPDFLSVQTELLYARGGKNWEGTLNGSDISMDIFADYIQMPWLVKITIPVILRPRIYFGPNVSLMFRSRIDGAPEEVIDSLLGETADIGGVFERYTNVIDIGLTTGLDFDIPFGPGNLVFDFRFNLGALNVFNFSNGSNVRNYNFILMAGYSIDFGGYDY